MFVHGRLNRSLNVVLLLCLASAGPSLVAAPQPSQPIAGVDTAEAAPVSTAVPARMASPATQPTAPANAPVVFTTATRASVAYARETAQSRAQREADTPKYKKDIRGNIIPDVRAAAAIVFNPQTNEVLWEENSHDQRSIASLTKLMTSVTFVADNPDLNRKVKVVASDVRNASVTYLRSGETISLGDVLHLTLIASDNGAARVLARTAEGGTKAFVGRMNVMAEQLGLTSSHYADPSGLDSRNVSSAYDVSHLIAYASQNEILAPVMRQSTYEAHTNRRTIKIKSTNKLLGTSVDVVAGKTGFINKAGYCLATLLQIPHGSQVAVVVLGASSSTIRFAEVRHLFNWVVGRTNGLVGGDELVEH